MKKILFILILNLPLLANVCTPLASPVNEPFPAVPSNGVDGISWSIARVQWTSDQLPSASTKQQVSYATATEWGVNPGVYPHLTGQITQTTSSSTQIQNAILSNLVPNTLYHFIGQSFQGGSWCTATDQTFTTLAKPNLALIKPTLPILVDTTPPSMNGTHWVYGSNCGTMVGTGYVVDTANLQDCLDKMVTSNGDDLALPPRLYKISLVNTHNSENSKSITISGSVFDNGGSAPANNSQVKFGSQIYGSIPSPINPGVAYYVVNSGVGGAGKFQVSFTNGGTPITLLNSGSTVSYIPYPLTQPKSVIHSTASANLLPPVGVRLELDQLAQYYPNMPNLQAVDPISGAASQSFFTLAPLTENLSFENVRFSIDPSVATSTNPVDPIAFKFPIIVNATNEGITWDQVAYDPGISPNRSLAITWEGVNNSIVNSYVYLDFWQPHYYATTLWSVTSNTINLPVSTWSYVGSGGTKVSCSSLGGTITISGSVNGNIALWVDPNCTWEAQLTTGLTASSTVAGMIITNAAIPTFPTYTYTAPLGGVQVNHAVIPFYNLTVNSGVIVNDINNNFFDPGTSAQASEGSIGIAIDLVGPIKIHNNKIIGSAITGIFWQEGATLNTTPCGSINPCPIQAIFGNLEVSQNTITSDFNRMGYDSVNWDGGNRYWRQNNENKTGRYIWYDGNIIGPNSSQVGAGQCYLAESFESRFIQIGNYTLYNNGGDVTFTNNTCIGTADGFSTAYNFLPFVNFPYPMKNFLLQNNLFINDNAYTQIAANQPFRSNGHFYPDPTQPTCGQGTLLNLAPMENVIFDHNTVLGLGGCQPFLSYMNQDFPSGGITNNFLNYLLDPGPFSGFVAGAVFFNSQSYLGGSCSTTNSPANLIFNCINNWQWQGNVILGTYSNSYPPSLTDMTSGQITTAQNNFTGYSGIWPNASTLALREAIIKWFDPSTNNLRLRYDSPYNSGNIGAKVTTDGLEAGANLDQIASHQGLVSNVRNLNITTNSVDIYFYAPDTTFACGVDWTTTNSSPWMSWTRITGTAGTRNQHVSLTSLPAHSLIYYRVNCAVQQPTGQVQLN